jgi:hypothetical protein
MLQTPPRRTLNPPCSTQPRPCGSDVERDLCDRADCQNFWRGLYGAVGGDLAAPGFPLPPNTYRALLRRVAQAVAGDPLAVRIIVRNPGHSRRARVLLSCARCAPRDRCNRCDANHKAGEHYGNRTEVHVLPPADAFVTRRVASRGEWWISPPYRPGRIEWSWLDRPAP